MNEKATGKKQNRTKQNSKGLIAYFSVDVSPMF